MDKVQEDGQSNGGCARKILDSVREEYGVPTAEAVSAFGRQKALATPIETSAELRGVLTPLRGKTCRVSNSLAQNEDAMLLEKHVNQLSELTAKIDRSIRAVRS